MSKISKLFQVRGAPAIAIVGCLSLAVELYMLSFDSLEELLSFIQNSLDYLVTARPTAVNLEKAAQKFINLSISFSKESNSVNFVKKR